MEAIGNSAEIQDQFLTLLVTQLRHQDPLEPTKQEDFIAQLAQFSTLEGIEKMNGNLESFLSEQQATQSLQNSMLMGLQQTQDIASAANLVGMEVEYDRPESAESTTGIVQSVVIEGDGISLRVGDQLVPFDFVRQIGQQGSTASQGAIEADSQNRIELGDSIFESRANATTDRYIP